MSDVIAAKPVPETMRVDGTDGHITLYSSVSHSPAAILSIVNAAKLMSDLHKAIEAAIASQKKEADRRVDDARKRLEEFEAARRKAMEIIKEVGQ